MIGWDTETDLIRPGLQAPPLVCATFAWGPDEVEIVHHTKLRPWAEALLDQPLIVGANTAFDFSVLAARWPDLIPRIFEAYAENRVTDVLLRDILIHIAQGIYRGYKTQDGEGVRLDYGLADVAWRRLRVVLEKSEWQLQFGRFLNEPDFYKWPEGAVNYAKTDAVATLASFVKQQETPEERRYLRDQFRQSRAAWWLQLMKCWGFRCDPEGVRAFARKTQQKYDELAEQLIEAGLARRQKQKDGFKIVRNEKLCRQYMEYVCATKGRIAPRTPSSDSHPRGQVKIDADTCQVHGDELLKKYGEFSSVTHTISTNIPLVQSGVEYPIQARFDVILDTGRTSSSPNVQNWNTDVGSAEAPEMRECVVPREGCLFAIGDYPGMELRTWSQCIIIKGWHSRMADFLNSGGDPHCEIACRILRMPYAETVADYKQDPKGKVYFPRQCGKVCNFGKPGGLGIKRLVDYARKNYGVILAEKPGELGDVISASELSEFWKSAWPEQELWFAWIKMLTQRPNAQIEHFYSERVRGGVSFTDGANGLFQGLAADAAKAAGFLIAKACYVDRDSPLYGGRIVNFIHDEFIVEVADNDNAHDAAVELGRLMEEGAKPWIPDVPPVVEPYLSRRWSKAAKPLFHPVTGRLVPWDFGVADELKKIARAA